MTTYIITVDQITTTVATVQYEIEASTEDEAEAILLSEDFDRDDYRHIGSDTQYEQSIVEIEEKIAA
jgi:hypothetical protein